MSAARILSAAAVVGTLGLVLSSCAPATAPGGSLVAIGHSGLTGYASDATLDIVAANSWATGDNPGVDSIFLRMREADPQLVENNFAVNGSDVDSLLDVQVANALSVIPAPTVIIVQSIDNDIRCDGSDSENLPVFAEKFHDVLEHLTSGAPGALVFVISQWGSVQAYADVMMTIDPSALAGGGPCDLVDPATLELLPDRVASLQGLVDDYQRAVADACADFDRCLWDGGAAQRMPLEAADLGPEHNHLSVAGHAKLAALEWAVLEPELAR